MKDLRRLVGPYHLIRYSVIAALLAPLAFVWLSLQVPMADVGFRAGGQGVVVASTPGVVFAVRSETPVFFQTVDGPILIAAARLAEVEEADAPDRLALARSLAAGPVRAQVVDAGGAVRDFTVSRRPAQFGDFSSTYWQNVICGGLAMLFALALWFIKPRDWAAGCFAWIGVWLFVTSAADGVVELWNLATGRELILASLIGNAASLHVFALSFLALFARFPGVLVSRRVLKTALAVAGLAAAASVAAIPAVGTSAAGALQAFDYAVLLGLMGAQFWAGRSDPAKRPALIILTTTIGLGVALYALTTLLPMIQGVYAPLAEAVAFPLFTLIFAGIGVSIVRAGVFALDGWSRAIMASIIFSSVVLLTDLALLRSLIRQQDVALGLSFALVALAYLPLREWMARRGERRLTAQMQQSLRLASDLAFATDDEARADRWAAALRATFQPLEVEADAAPVAAPELAELGVALRVPPVAGAPALVCRHADGGRRAFDRGDVEAVGALAALVERMIASRDSYVQGATEERRRIARDLHDDVSGRLITSLHRSDIGAMRHDVRDAMADIRTIVTGLAGEDRRLGDLLADLRHECQSRCDAAGLALDWAFGPEMEDPRPLDYGLHRNLTAMVRECVSNVIRHAEARTLAVEIALEGERLKAAITDDGRGMNGDGRRGRGLANCSQRAEALGGSFRVAPVPRGSEVRFEVRLAAE